MERTLSGGTFHRNQQAVVRALSHIKANGLDDIFKPPMFLNSLELSVANKNIEKLDKHLTEQSLKFLNCRDLLKCSVGKVKSFFVPKDHNTFRRVAWCDLLDAVKYTALSFIFADKIEAARIEKSLGIVHSHRIMSTPDCLFDSQFGYSSFRQASKAKSLQYVNGYKVVTDISNFFDRVSLHAIEGMLVSIDCDKEDVDFLHRVMIHFAGRSSFGLPVGGDASRILSEAALINVDKRLLEDGVDFIRYVDDYRIFATSRSKAYAAVLALTSYLYEEGLFINYAKTHMEKITVLDTEPEQEEKTMPQEHKPIDENEQVVAYRSS